MNRLLALAILFAATYLLAACQIQPVQAIPEAAAEMSDAEKEAANLDAVQRFYEEFAAGSTTVILDVHAPTITMHYAGSAEDVPALALSDDLNAIKAGIPSLHAEVHDMWAAGDYVFTELTWAGTQTGDLFGIPATGNPIVHNGIVVRRLEDGKIVESWEIWDDLTLMAEFGLTPSWDEIVAAQQEQ